MSSKEIKGTFGVGEADQCANANFLAFFPGDGRINRKRGGEFCPKSVIADRLDPCALAMFPHNSQLTQTLEHPERPVQLYFPSQQKPGSSSQTLGPEPSSMIQLEREQQQDERMEGGGGGDEGVEGYPEHTLGVQGCYGYGCGNYSVLVIAHAATPVPGKMPVQRRKASGNTSRMCMITLHKISQTI